MSTPTPTTIAASPSMASASTSLATIAPSTATLKRRTSSMTPTPDFSLFTDSASSFQPKPYQPNTRSSFSAANKSGTTSRNRSEAPSQPPSTDPSPSDPDVVFIHPPFTQFPGAERGQGLSYNLIGENPDWFLDPKDFVSAENTNPNAIPYPTFLEPPRGWCPSKKRDLKQRGGDGWPEGEEPRLRCTFCRRTYAGVNAKSMWRRHVFEKHKIAMSNRRDGAGGSNVESRSARGGRGSTNSKSSASSSRESTLTTFTEENKLNSSRIRDSHETLVDVVIDPQLTHDDGLSSPPHRAKFRSTTSDTATSNAENRPLGAPVILQKDFPNTEIGATSSRPHPLSQSTLPLLSPPPTPQNTTPRVSSNVSPQELEAAQQLIAVAHTPVPVRFLRPPPGSPYDPTVTPAFRHSPARLPSEQPWRYSPSNPFHARTREVILTTLMPSESPAVRQATFTASPGSLSRTGIGGLEMNTLGTPESMERFKPSPSRSLLQSASKGRLSLTIADKRNKSHNDSHQHNLFEDSPLSRMSNSRNGSAGKSALSLSHRRTISEAADDWFASDPFAEIYSNPFGAWGRSRIGSPSKLGLGNGYDEGLHRSPPMSGFQSDQESPVLRSDMRTGLKPTVSMDAPPLAGLGIGLMEPFSLPGDNDSDKEEGENPKSVYSVINTKTKAGVKEDRQNPLASKSPQVYREPSASRTPEGELQPQNTPPAKRRKISIG